eukprot:318382-Chlamydomonas_euryale.AAC.1
MCACTHWCAAAELSEGRGLRMHPLVRGSGVEGGEGCACTHWCAAAELREGRGVRMHPLVRDSGIEGGEGCVHAPTAVRRPRDNAQQCNVARGPLHKHPCGLRHI